MTFGGVQVTFAIRLSIKNPLKKELWNPLRRSFPWAASEENNKEAPHPHSPKSLTFFKKRKESRLFCIFISGRPDQHFYFVLFLGPQEKEQKEMNIWTRQNLSIRVTFSHPECHDGMEFRRVSSRLDCLQYPPPIIAKRQVLLKYLS